MLDTTSQHKLLEGIPTGWFNCSCSGTTLQLPEIVCFWLYITVVSYWRPGLWRGCCIWAREREGDPPPLYGGTQMERHGLAICCMKKDICMIKSNIVFLLASLNSVSGQWETLMLVEYFASQVRWLTWIWCVSVVVLLIKRLVENSPCMVQANLAIFSGAVEWVAVRMRSSWFGRMWFILNEIMGVIGACIGCLFALEKDQWKSPFLIKATSSLFAGVFWYLIGIIRSSCFCETFFTTY